MDIVAILGIMIPLAPFMLAALYIWTRHQRAIAEMQVEATAEKAAQYAQHTQALEERVRVLERIVTDRGFSIAAEIESLRFEDSDRRIETPPLAGKRA